MWIDLLAVAVLAVFVIIGAVRGTFAGILRVGTLIVSYAAGFFAATSMGHVPALALGWSPLFGSAVAGAVAFVGTFAILNFAGWLALRQDKRRRGDLPRTGVDRLGGSLIGALQGGLIVLLIGWAGMWLEAAQNVGDGESTVVDSVLSEVTQSVVAVGADLALDDSAEGRLARNLVVSPGATLQGFQAVVENPRVQALQNDTLFWQYVQSGAIDSALNRGSFLSIAYDPNLRGELVDLGLIPESGRENSKIFRERAHATLTEIGPRIQAIKNDPALHELAQDPEVQAALAAGDTFTLLRHPEFRALINRAMSSNPGGGAESGPEDSGEYRPAGDPGA